MPFHSTAAAFLHLIILLAIYCTGTISLDYVSVCGKNLLVNGRPFVANGAAGKVRLDLLKQLGANVVRTYGDEASAVLDAAQAVGLKVLLGFWMGQPSQGYVDYNNQAQVNAQLNSLRDFVNKYKDHPALLLWGVGNEVETGATNTTLIWTAVDQAAKLVRSLDPDHPTMAVLAELGTDKAAQLRRYAPNIQVLGVNSYGPSLPTVATRARAQGWRGPLIITELGALGQWQANTTAWGAAIEPNSDQKALLLEQYMSGLSGSVQGQLVFLWGDKPEETPTWHSLLLPQSNEYERSAEVMASHWKGTLANRAPRINSFSFTNNLNTWTKGTVVRATLSVTEPDGDSIKVLWSVLAENVNSVGTNYTSTAISGASSSGVSIQGTLASGAYRLYMAALDGKGAAATANLPFYVN